MSMDFLLYIHILWYPGQNLYDKVRAMRASYRAQQYRHFVNTRKNGDSTTVYRKLLCLGVLQSVMVFPRCPTYFPPYHAVRL